MTRDLTTPRNARAKRMMDEESRRRLREILAPDTVTGSWRGDRNAMQGRALEYQRPLRSKRVYVCDYRGRNTSDGRCPKCGERAHRQRKRRSA